MIRRGMSLTEVLVAIFVMGLGLMAILTLFPLGALSMAQALKDERCAQAAANARAWANGFLLSKDINVDPYFRRPQSGNLAELSPLFDGPSYPVYVDPIGDANGMGAMVSSVMPRRSPTFIATPVNTTASKTALAWRFFSLQDDLAFADNGTPQKTGSLVRRENRYTWAIMMRRPKCNEPTVVDTTVVVYSGRPFGGSFETVYTAQGAPGSNAVTIPSNPPIRRGSWIMDATPEPPGAGQLQWGPVHAFFYRVVNVTPLGSSGIMLELQTSLRASCSRVLYLEGVAEVFEKGPGWEP